jgi:hypothetical protein
VLGIFQIGYKLLVQGIIGVSHLCQLNISLIEKKKANEELNSNKKFKNSCPKDTNSCFSKEYPQMVIKHLKRCSIQAKQKQNQKHYNEIPPPTH